MPDLSRSELAAYAACAVLVGLLGWRVLHRDAHAPRSPAARVEPHAASRRVVVTTAAAVVQVGGAVRRPGVYRLRAGQRVQAAVRRAGGATAAADLDAINLAAKIGDGQQIVVPTRAPMVAGAAPSAAGTAASSGPAAAGPPVNLNSATAEQLDALDGVGPATAQKILAYRREHGGFRRIDDLGLIPGIGPKRLAALRGRVTV